MPNPLRLPIVLIVVFGTLVLYVHLDHRRQHGTAESSSAESERLQLRQLPQPSSNVISSTPNSIDPARQDEKRLGTGGPDADPGVAKGDTSTSRPATPPPRLGAILAPTDPQADLVPTNPQMGVQPDVNGRSATTGSSTTRVREHRVVDGDTLPHLAERYLGDPARYLEIFQANRDILVDPDLLPLGVRLRIP